MMKLIVTHPTGNQNVRAAVKGFIEAGIETNFKTTVATFPDGWLSKVSGLEKFSQLKKRCYDPKLKLVTETWPWLEAARLLALKAGIQSLVKHERGLFSVDAVYRNLDKRVAGQLSQVAKNGVEALYSYEDGALNTFTAAKKLGLRCFYDLPIGYWRVAHQIFQIERERWPEWASTLTGLHDSMTKLGQKDEELRMADAVFVASSFTARTLKKFPGTLPDVEVIPYGFPPVGEERDYSSSSKGPLKVLFVGGLSQRKGIANLFSAVSQLKAHVRLTVIGKKTTQECEALNKELAKNTWIPALAHHDILKEMRRHDVLVFPSLFEGFGLVITEAMSQGTPVITTDRTAGPEFIDHGRNGWLIESGSTQAVTHALEEILSNRSSIPEVGRAAMETARQRPWEVYGRELAQAVCNQLENHPVLS